MEIDRWLEGYARGWFWAEKHPERQIPGALHIEQDSLPSVTLWDSIDPVEELLAEGSRDNLPDFVRAEGRCRMFESESY